MGTPKEVPEKIEVVVELHPSLEPIVPSGDDSSDFYRCLEQYLDDLVEDLRLPVGILLTISPCEEPGRFPVNKTLYRIRINGRQCRLELQTRTAAAMAPSPLSQIVAKDIYRNRELMLTPALSERIRQSWLSEKKTGVVQTMSAAGFHDLLSLLVERGSRVDRAKEIERIANDREEEPCVQPTFEAIIDTPTATAIRVLLSEAQYDRFVTPGTTLQSPADRQSFQETLDGLDSSHFYDLGIILPVITVASDDRLAETEFRIQLNDLRFPPMTGLSQDQFLVSRTPEELQSIHVAGVPAINPATGNPCAIVNNRQDALDKCQKEFVTWGPIEFIRLSLSGELNRNTSLLLTRQAVECSLDMLSDKSPALVHATLERFDVITLTGIMRDLLKDNISIRNLRSLLESLLSVRKLKSVDIATYVSRVREDFKRYITHKYSHGRNTLTCYLLAPQIEARLATSERQPLTEDEQCRLLESLSGAVSGRGQKTVLLTSLEVRRKLRCLIDKELPSLVIIAYQELSPDTNITPLGPLG